MDHPSRLGRRLSAYAALLLSGTVYPAPLTYPIVDTGQTTAIGTYLGQDAHYQGSAPSYVDHGDGTITDQVTGLMWTKTHGKKMTWEEAKENARNCDIGGHLDWRLPTIKELYSLVQFTGIDPDPMSSDTENLIPFIDSSVFDFQYGDPAAGERIIDSQFATSTIYTSTTMRGAETMFGVNFADGRIKGYGIEDPRGRGAKTFHVLYVRGNPAYGDNRFHDHGDGTITDEASGLTWMKGDSGEGMEWPSALKYAEAMDFAGHSDWRLPSAKELQSLVDYSRAPDSTQSAAIDPIFDSTPIVNVGGQEDYAAYWTSTTHQGSRSNQSAVYLNFGRSLGWMENRRSGEKQLLDVHGAGAQRSDPKTGDPSQFPFGRGPQGDVIGIENMVRLVRGGHVQSVDPPVARETASQENPEASGHPQNRPRSGAQRPRAGQQASSEARGQATQRTRPRDRVRARDTEFQTKFPLGATLPDGLMLYDENGHLIAANRIFK
ncbi:MAG: DUF1566 domain-containing protein, partial [Verrucomicrobiales bacterium]